MTDERTIAEKAEALAASYVLTASSEVKEILDPLVRRIALELGESSEAWRGAELLLQQYGQMLRALADAGATDSRFLLMVAGMFTGAMLDQPGMRALRGSP